MSDGDHRRKLHVTVAPTAFAGATAVRRSGTRKRKGSPLRVDVVPGAGVRAPGLARWLASVAPARARGQVTVAFVTDARIRALNRQYRKKDTPTDVLSFPAEGPPPGPARAGRHDRYVASAFRRTGSSAKRPNSFVGSGFSRTTELGDIVIAEGVARRQAHDAGHSLQTEIRILALHGLLHLLGYDHEHDEGQMARLERRLRRKGGLREGLIERGSAALTARGAR